MTNLLNFTRSQLLREEREHGANSVGRRANRIGLKGIVNAGNEIGLAAFFCRGCGWPPMFVINATQVFWKLRSKARRA